MRPKIMITAGGTYGHIYPALSVAEAIKKNFDAEVIFVSSNKELGERLSCLGIKAYFIDSCKNKGNSLFSFTISLFRLLKVTCVCFFLLLKAGPRVVIGFGGYAAFPLVFSACLLGLPTAIHEQNVVMGRANRFLLRFVDRVFLSFSPEISLNPLAKPATKYAESGNYRAARRRKTIVTGNPIRPQLKQLDRKEALEYLGLDGELFTVLVMGGSLGAHNINENFKAAVLEIKDKPFQFIHLTGKNDFESLAKVYASLGVKHRVFGFYGEMSYIFSASDLIISRAGAQALSEIAYFNIPAVLIPYPYASAHQMENAKVLAKAGKAAIIEDNKLTPDYLLRYLVDFIASPDKLAQMKEIPFSFGNAAAADKIAEELIKISASGRKR